MSWLQPLLIIVTPSFIFDITSVLDLSMYINILWDSVKPCKFWNFWKTCNKWLSIRHKHQFKKDKFSDNNWIVLSSHFWKLMSFSSYENKIVATVFSSDDPIILWRNQFYFSSNNNRWSATTGTICLEILKSDLLIFLTRFSGSSESLKLVSAIF